jgi:hypothetical protein
MVTYVKMSEKDELECYLKFDILYIMCWRSDQDFISLSMLCEFVKHAKYYRLYRHEVRLSTLECGVK